jgi:hypothetical protein
MEPIDEETLPPLRLKYTEPPKHPWMARLCVAAIMLMLAFVGMMITHVKTSEGWDYWRWTVGIYALLALWLSWYMKRQTKARAHPLGGRHWRCILSRHLCPHGDY